MTSPRIDVRAHLAEGKQRAAHEAESRLRLALEPVWGEMQHVAMRLVDSGPPSRPRLCRINAVLADGTQVAAESAATSLRDAVIHAVERLVAAIARHVSHPRHPSSPAP